MKPPEVVKEEFTREWVQKAETDFKTAEHLCQSSPDFAEGAAFHSQQAAEKYLKAFLVWHQIEFQKTHDIETLLKLAEKMDSGTNGVKSLFLTLGDWKPFRGDRPFCGESEYAKARGEIKRRCKAFREG